VVLVQRGLVETGLRRDGAEAQRIHDGDRTRAHGKDVAQNAAHAGGSTLERLDERRMVVRLDFEGAGPAIAYVDDAGVFSRTLYYATAVRGQPLQVNARGFVGAVLAPHHAEDAQLRKRGLAAERLQDAVVFFRRDSMVAKRFWSDGGFFGEAGSAINWVHGNQEGNTIVACSIWLREGTSAAQIVRKLGLAAPDRVQDVLIVNKLLCGERRG
jgi:hypothetical protein